MKNYKIQLNDYLFTLPILVIFTINVLLLGENFPVSDGIRYWDTASDILDGFQKKSILDSYFLLNGPIYPLILAFLKGIGFSVKASIYFNAFFLYVGFTFFYKTLYQYISFKKSLLATYILVFIDPFLFYWTAKLYSEPLAIFLVCFLIFYINRFIKSNSKKDLLLSSFIFSILALTRVIFAYVALSIVILGFVGWFIFKSSLFKNLLKLSVFSLVFCIPYLIFTYSVTKKVFYFSGNGGMLLYWTSSPYSSDMGEWHTLQINHDHFAERYSKFSGLDSLYLRKVNDIIINEINSNHKDFADSLKDKDILEYDQALKDKAAANIKSYPISFIKNWILNTGRLLVGIPHAIYHKPPFSPHFTLLNTIKSSFLLFLLLVSLFLSLRNKWIERQLLISTILILIIYLGGQSLLAVQSQRFLLPVYPLIIFIISVSLHNNLILKSNKK